MAKQTALQKKISVKTVFGKLNAAVIAKHENTVDNQLPVMSIMGIASGTKTGTSDYGQWLAFTGQFKAINPNNGEVFMSSNCFLPDVAADMFAGEVQQGRTVEFAFNIIAELDDDSSVGFIYKAVPLMNEEHNPLAALEAKLQGGTLALPAPSKKGGKKKPVAQEEASAE